MLSGLFFFRGGSENQEGRPDLWLSDRLSTSNLKPLNGTWLWQNVTGSKNSASSNKCVSVRSENQDGRPGPPLICWDIFDFSYATAERNWQNLKGNKKSMSSTKSVFLGRSENQDGFPGFWLVETFGFLLELQPLNGMKWNLRGSKISMSPIKSVPLASAWLRLFDFSSGTAKRNLMKLYRKEVLSVLLQFCVFRVEVKCSPVKCCIGLGDTGLPTNMPLLLHVLTVKGGHTYNNNIGHNFWTIRNRE